MNMIGNENDLQNLTEKIKNCIACPLCESRTNTVPGIYGSFNGLCFIGEAPGYYEDQQGLPFVGRSGNLLNKMLNSVGLRREEVSILNVVKCRPTNEEGSNRTPTINEVKFCAEKWLLKQVSYLQPKLLVTLGSVSLRFFFPNARVTKEAGQMKTTEYGYKLFITYHPAYLLRNPQPSLLEQYENHFQQIAAYLKGKNNQPEVKKKAVKPKQQTSLIDFFNK
ncbi:MAG: uracil-DNA glycosylase [Candidatus Heimdallarchaeaceae archaeon]